MRYKGYRIVYSYEHYDVYEGNIFLFSSDTLEEAKQEIDNNVA